MRKSAKPPKRIMTRLPNSFSSACLGELKAAISSMAEGGFKKEYLEAEMFSKYLDPKLTSPAVRRSKAIEKWQATELRNSATNQRLLFADADFGWIKFPALVFRVRSLIAKILGPMSYPEVLLDLRHTNGASTRVPRSEVTALLKLEGDAHVSNTALKHWYAAAKMETSRLSAQNLVPTESSVLFTVDKNSEIDRVACKEPEINMLMQRSVGQHIRRRLKVFGIDLNDQTVNQRLAARAVRDGLATIDLSSASDSISRQLVLLLLPFEWWSLLDDIRVKSTLVDDQLHELEMFSSMGNGFTFELESLLFYAITRVVCERSRVHGKVSVYGDDIVAPIGIVPRLIRVFHYIGFRTNVKKTFWKGKFRESCGRHYYAGFNVTPFFVRRKVSLLPDLIRLLNQVMEWDGRGFGFIIDPGLLSWHSKYSEYVPEYLWGGVDPMDPTCLVTGHKPRYRLTPRVEESDFVSESGYLHWFMCKESSPSREVAVEPTWEKGTKCSRVSRGWLTQWNPWLLKEA